MENVENGNLFSNPSNLLCEDSKKRSNLQSLIEWINKELPYLHQCILAAKSFKYPNATTAMFAEKILDKYYNSIMQIDSTSLSTKKSIWAYAHEYLDLSFYEKKLTVASITLSYVDFSVLLSSLKDDICSNMKTFVVLSLNLVNLAMNFQYSFYLVSIDLKKYDFNNPIDVIYFHMWLEEEFPYYEISFDSDSYEKTDYNAIVQNAIRE